MAEEKKLGKNVEKLVEDISKLTVMELSELVEALQEKLGVSAAVPVAATATTTASTATSEEGQQQPTSGANQTVVMTNAGANKIAVIKALREINPNLGLKEAKDMTEAVPAEVVKDVKPEAAKEAADKLKAAGATVEVK